MTQLRDLAKPFTTLVKAPPKGKFGHYVEHSAVTQRLLAHLGAFEQTIKEPIYDDHPELGKVLTGVILTLTLNIDGEKYPVDEAGDVENPFRKKQTNGARLKEAVSDAHKRCAMRFGLGLHLYARDEEKEKDDYFLDKLLEEVKNGNS